MDTNTTLEKRKFRLTPEERTSWDKNGYFVRLNVFTEDTLFASTFSLKKKTT